LLENIFKKEKYVQEGGPTKPLGEKSKTEKQKPRE